MDPRLGQPVPAPAPAPEPDHGDPIHPGSGRQPLLKRIWGPLAAVGLLLAKLGTKLKAILLLAPKLKLLTTSGTMLVSIAAYSLIWGWTFALGFVLLLLIHEMGHVLQLRREGVEASAPMFIPFLGAVISAKSMGRRRGGGGAGRARRPGARAASRRSFRSRSGSRPETSSGRRSPTSAS